MQPTQDPTHRFLVSTFANIARMVMTPLYYAIRSDMGIQYSGFFSIFESLILYGVSARLIALMSEADGAAARLYVFLVALGYIRNFRQANHRRRTGDWSVSCWSTGNSLVEPVLFLVCTGIQKRWGKRNPLLFRLARLGLQYDFVYYVAEPAVLFTVACALWSIGSVLSIYIALLAVGLILVRYHSKLHLYLRAHEVADAQKFERLVMGQFEGPVALASTGVVLAEIPAETPRRQATDAQSVFDRLSPELQALLARNGSPKR